MSKEKKWILGGMLAITLIIATTLIILKSIPEKEVVLTSHPTANGGTVTAADETAAFVQLNPNGTSVGDAIYEYKSKYGYSVQYNNKYIVDFGNKNYDFSIRNESDTVNIVIKNIPREEGFVNIQTKEEWDSLMGGMLGESKEFKRTVVNNMDALVGHYILDYGNGMQSDVIFAILIGDEYLYTYMYNAAMNAPQDEAIQIGAVLYTMKQI